MVTKPELKKLHFGDGRRAASVSEETLVTMQPLVPGSLLPLVARPAMDGIDLIAWAKNHRNDIHANLLRCGAILFRGFELRGPNAFAEFIQATADGGLLAYTNRSTPRTEIGGNIYTATEYPANQVIPLHNENSYQSSWPLKIYFFCVTAPQQGGATPIADSRKVFERIPSRIKEEFAERGVMYVRNYGDGLDLSWQDVFQTTDQSQVEAFCRREGLEFEWKDGNRLRTRQICQAIASHPETGELVWFNQAHLFHVSSLAPDIREYLLVEVKEADLPRHAYYGDGTPIQTLSLTDIRAAYKKEKVTFAWEEGDILLLDNMLTTHGREPFVGPREILVGMAESYRVGKSEIKTDEDNLVLARSSDYVDELNAQFYGRFPYPWRPVQFNYLLDPDFETVMLNQDLGDWQHRTIPRQPKIWVAGCGTNQAVWTALRFPKAAVIGSDLSVQSLELAAKSARELQLTNLELRNESINQVDYVEQFDYVICTGVIHHNAQPQAALKKLAGALKATGILELMVYNRYHRIITTAFQKAIRTLSGNKSASGFELELTLARRMIENFPIQNVVSDMLRRHQGAPEASLADSLLQPVEQSYTVESLDCMANDCDLEILLPCINRYDRAQQTFSWNMEFDDALTQEYLDVLPDISRWQVANLLLLDKSPHLWFYLQRSDSGRTRKSEREICEEFLDTTFIRSTTQQVRYNLGADGVYEPLSGAVEFPRTPSNQLMRRIIDLADGVTSMRQIFCRLDIEPAFQKVNQARIELTTSTSPHLGAVKR